MARSSENAQDFGLREIERRQVSINGLHLWLWYWEGQNRSTCPASWRHCTTLHNKRMRRNDIDQTKTASHCIPDNVAFQDRKNLQLSLASKLIHGEDQVTVHASNSEPQRRQIRQSNPTQRNLQHNCKAAHSHQVWEFPCIYRLRR